MSVSSLTLCRRAAILCFIISITLFLIPNSSVSRGSAASFGVIIDNTEPIRSDLETFRIQVFQGIQEQFKQRQQNLEQHCSMENRTATDIPPSLLYSRNLSIVYCPVHSAASTQIKHAMLLSEKQKIKSVINFTLTHRIDSQAQKLNLPAKVRRNPKRLKTNRLATILVTRNPWRVLLSVYLTDKSEFSRPCQRFTNKKTRTLDFEGFLRCLINHTTKDMKRNTLDVRLSPVTYSCAACNVPYNTLVHYERLSEELSAIPTPTAHLLVENMNKSEIQESIKISDNNYQEYINGVQRQTIDDIQRIYRRDFLYFGYDML